MPQTSLDNLALQYDWDAGDDAWKAGVDANWVKLDAWTLPNVIDQRNTPPAGAFGLRHLVGSAGTGLWTGQNNALAAWDGQNSVWVFVTPNVGAEVFDQALELRRRWDGTAWQPINQAIAQAAAITISNAHLGATIELDTTAAARDVTIPQESSDALHDGFHFWVVNNSGSNNVTFTLTGLTTRGIAAMTADRQALRIVKIGTDTWISS